MILGVLTIVCIAAFVCAAFALRVRMHKLAAIYEARTKTLQLADLAENDLDAALLERQLNEAAQNVHIMICNKVLFRTLWPHEYDATFYNAQRFIAQSNSALLTSVAR